MTERDSGVSDPHGGLLLDPPHELRFRGPFDDYVTVSLVIKNPTDKMVAFKIKTTAPKRYCVKPNSGVLDSNQSMKVNVLLQPFNYDPNEKNKHKFMVQYMYLDDNEARMPVNDILNMWKDVQANRLLDLKLRCIFEYTDADVQRPAATANNTASQQQQQQSSSPQLQPQQSSDSQVSSTTTTSRADQQQRNTVNNNNNTSPVNTRKSAAAAQAAQAAAQSSAASSTTANDKADFSSADTSRLTDNNATLRNKTAYTSATSLLDAASSSSRDNASNELKLLKKENESLKSEIEKLRINETRLSKLALQNAHGVQQPLVGQDLMGNKLILVIVVLIAVIVYLMLFK